MQQRSDSDGVARTTNPMTEKPVDFKTLTLTCGVFSMFGLISLLNLISNIQKGDASGFAAVIAMVLCLTFTFGPVAMWLTTPVKGIK